MRMHSWRLSTRVETGPEKSTGMTIDEFCDVNVLLTVRRSDESTSSVVYLLRSSIGHVWGEVKSG